MRKLLTLAIIFAPFGFTQTYDEDTAEIYMANNEVEETLNTANNILCIISKLKVEEFIDKGPYKATVFEDRCDVAGARADAQAAASGGNQQQGAAPEIEVASIMIVDVVSAFSEVKNQDYIEVKSWYYQEGDYSEAQADYEGLWDAEPDQLIYALTKVWSGATADDPNGDIELDFVVESNCQKAPYESYEAAKAAAEATGLTEGQNEFWRFMDQFWKCPPIGYQMGSGRLDTVDDKVLFLGPRGRNILLTDNPNGRDGIWQQGWFDCILDNKFIDYQNRETAGCGPEERENSNYWSVDVVLGFSFDETTKASCKKIVKVNRRTPGEDGDTITDVTAEWKAIDFDLGNYPWRGENGPAAGVNETCESTNADDAKLSVWEYGLYTNSDGKRYDLKNPGFELKSLTEFQSPWDENRTESIYAWADYWGTHVGEEWRENLTETLAFEKVNSDDTAQYFLKQRKMNLRKMSIDKVSLNSLSGTEVDLHIEWDLKDTGSDCWRNSNPRITGYSGTQPIYDTIDNDSNGEDDRCNKERWKSLGVPVDSGKDIFLGYWDAAYSPSGATPVGTFVFDRAVTKNASGRWIGEDEITPFTFTPEEYLIAWDENKDANDGYEVWRNIWAHGRGQGYEIRQAALADPTANEVRRRTEKDISTADIAGKTLGCLGECFSGDSFAAYYNGALTLISQGTEDSPAQGTVPSPYTGRKILEGDSSAVPTGPYSRSGSDKGNWTQDGILSDEILQYQASGDTLADTITNVPIALPAEMYEVNDPWDKFREKICYLRPNGVDRECWMVNHMTLFDMDNASEVECEKTRDSNGDGTLDDYERHYDSSVETSENKRYCRDKLWQMTEYYDVNWDTWVNYQAFDANGVLVEISRPEGVTFDIPDDSAKFGKKAGRKETLEYAGFGRLWGMGWENFNIVDWVAVDEYLDWNTLSESERQAIRGFPEYIVPDGSILLSEDGTELKSKFLRGEYFLKPLASAVGNNIYSTNPAGLDDQQPAVYDSAFIGPAPETGLLNDGNPCVDHGEIVCTIPQ
jgi:hypothetical protein